MTITDQGNAQKIILSKAFDSRAKILNAFYFACFITPVPVFLNVLFTANDANLLLVILTIGFATLGLIAAYRFINKALKSEILLLDANKLTITIKGFLSQKSNYYETKHIAQLIFLAKPEVGKHPLAGESFDYLGFQTQQQVINEMYGDNRVAFDYEGAIVTFGENIYSWDFEKLQVLFKNMIGLTFKFNEEFEKTFMQEPDDESAAESTNSDEMSETPQ